MATCTEIFAVIGVILTFSLVCFFLGFLIDWYHKTNNSMRSLKHEVERLYKDVLEVRTKSN